MRDVQVYGASWGLPLLLAIAWAALGISRRRLPGLGDHLLLAAAPLTCFVLWIALPDRTNPQTGDALGGSSFLLLMSAMSGAEAVVALGVLTLAIGAAGGIVRAWHHTATHHASPPAGARQEGHRDDAR